MPLFLSEEEFDRIKASGDAPAVGVAADAFIQSLYADLDTVNADAASITAEQTCSVLEQKYLSLSSEYSSMESRNLQLDSSLQQRVSELAQVQADKHQLHLKLIKKDGEIERLSTEVKELQKSNRQLVELVRVKDVEVSERNSTISSYLNKLTDLTDRATQRDARLSELEPGLVRFRANCDKLSQEKELIEKHNAWLNDELTVKVDSFLEQRRKSAEIEADMSSKLADMEKQYNTCSSSLSRQKDRVRELETKLEVLHQELCSAKYGASATEQRYSAEISTVSKLVDLYKESSEEWSKKAGELEGVIKALETHLSQVESDYKDKLEKEASSWKEAEKESTELKEKLAKCEAELEASRKASELDVLPFSINTENLMHTANSENVAGGVHALVPLSFLSLSYAALRAWFYPEFIIHMVNCITWVGSLPLRKLCCCRDEELYQFT